MNRSRLNPVGAACPPAPYGMTCRVSAGLAAAGFDDLRPAHTAVFQHIDADGTRITDLAERDLPDLVYVENLTSALYLDKQADVDRYLLAMERLCLVAYEPHETPRILDEIIKQLEAADDE